MKPITYVPANSDDGYYLTLVACHGRCTCVDFCDEELSETCCRLCSLLDSEFPCPNEDEDAYCDPDTTRIEGAAG